jgi:hypothetical protein
VGGFFGRIRKEVVLGAAIAGFGLLFAAGLYRIERDALLERSEAESRQILEIIAEDAVNIFGPARDVVASVEAARVADLPRNLARPAFLAVTTGPVRQIPQLNSVYIGFSDGSFWQTRQQMPGFVADDPRTPRDAETGVQRTITAMQTGELVTVWSVYDRSARRWVDIPEPGSNYDPRQRPWYRVADGNADIHWSAPYRSATGGEWTVTMSQSLLDREGRQWGVVAVDFYIDRLGTLLETWHERRLSPEAWIGILGTDGRIVARAPAAAATELDSHMK